MEGDTPLTHIFFLYAHGSLSRKMMIIPMLEKRKQGLGELIILQRGSQGSGSASAHLILMRAHSPTGPGGPGPGSMIL